MDTPAYCVSDTVIGVWEVTTSADYFVPDGDQVNCPTTYNTSKTKIQFTLLERGTALTTTGNVRSGRWTQIANQGFEVRFGGVVYFFFQNYTKENVSECNSTAAGYVHQEGMLQQQFRCAYAELIKPAVSDIQALNLLRNYNDPEGHALWVGSNLPTNFTWSNVSGINYLPTVFNQKQCGSCFAAATVQGMMARVKVTSNNTDKLDGDKVKLSVQHVVDCCIYSQGCSGGFGEEVAKFSEDFGVLLESDYGPYVAVDEPCMKKTGTRYHFTGYQYLGGYFGADNTVDSMMWELYRYGPYPVSVYVDSQTIDNKSYSDFRSCKRNSTYPGIRPTVPIFPELTEEQIMSHDGKHYYLKKSNHLVLLTGWGEDEEGQYWEIQNSWGDTWCQNGFIRIQRGTNEYGVEQAPIVFYWTDNVEAPTDQKVELSEPMFNLLVSLCVIFGVLFIAGIVVASYYVRKGKAKVYEKIKVEEQVEVGNLQ